VKVTDLPPKPSEAPATKHRLDRDVERDVEDLVLPVPLEDFQRTAVILDVLDEVETE
jgi:hypothetical protein